MAKILYGICGEGLGHASRSRILINHLKNHHEIRIVAGGKAYDLLFQEYKHVEKIESPRFIYKDNQVLLTTSVLYMLYRTLLYTPFSFLKVHRLIKEFKPDVLITDAEPVSNYAALLAGIKRLSIDNPQVLLYRDYTVTVKEFLSWFSLLIAVKFSMMNANKYLVYDFFDEQIENKKVLFLKPLIQENIRKQTPRYDNHIFVYQTSMSTEYVCTLFRKFKETFIIYGFNKDSVDGNLIFRSFNEQQFFKDIAHAKAVITNGGFTVISEALYLKKPIFSLPLKNQFEQVVNGKFIEKLGAGVYHMDFKEENLKEFLQNLTTYQNNLRQYDPGDQLNTLQRIEQELQLLLASS
jgi:uncharacterized protein (TIGR00661 family)